MARPAAAVLCALLLSWSAGCAPSDPRERVLSERAKWTVTPLSWSVGEDRRVTLTARVSGPSSTKIERLTVRVDLLDGQGGVVDEEWWTLDLSEVRRGGPKDVMVRFPAGPGVIEELLIDAVPQPTAEEATHIEELEGT